MENDEEGKRGGKGIEDVLSRKVKKERKQVGRSRETDRETDSQIDK